MSTPLRRRARALLLAAACLAGAPPFTAAIPEASAATYTWTGSNALWSTSNWVWTGGTTTFPGGNSGTNTAIINSGTVTFGVSDTFGNADTTSSPVIRVGSGATLASGGGFTTLYNLELNGGTLFSNGGLGSGVGTFQLGGTLTVGGNTASTISTGAGSYNVINVGAAANSVLTLNVADATNSSAADLTIGTVLQNYYAFAGTRVGSLTKAGAGTAVLTAANTYTGTTSVNAGTLQIGNGSTSGSLASTSAITGSAGGTLVFNRSDNYGGNFSNSIGGAVNIALNGGALTLTTNNTYSGTTTIASGTLGIGGGGTTGSLGTGPVVNNASLVFDRYTNNWTVASPISGSGSVMKRGGATMTLSGSNTFSGDFNQWSGVTILSNTTGPALYADGSPGRIVISNELGGSSYLYDAVVMGAANQLGSNVDVSIQPRNISSGYSYLVLQGNDTTIGNLSSTQAYASSWAVVENTEGGTGYAASRLTVTQTVNGTFSGEFRDGNWNGGSGGIGLTKNGAATLTLADGGGGGIAYTGSTIVNAGKLVISSTNFNSAVSTAAGATFEINAAVNQTLKSAVIVSGSGTFVKSGIGALAFGSANTYSGGTVINGGFLLPGASSITGSTTATSQAAALNNGTGTVTINGGALQLGYRMSNTVTATVSNPIVLAGGAIWAHDAYQHLGGTLNVSTSGTLGSTYEGVTNAWNKGLFLDGVVSGSGALTLMQAGAGGEAQGFGNETGNAYNASIVMFTNGGNTYSGTITVTGGGTGLNNYLGVNHATTLQYATVNVLGNNSGSNLRWGSSAVLFQAGVGGAFTLAALSGNGDIALTEMNQTTAVAGNPIALTVGGNNASTTYSGVMSGSGSLTKLGTGVFTLAGNNTYTGSTTVNAGKLVVSGTTFNSPVTTAAGATFEIASAANYTLKSAVVVSGSGVFAKSGAGWLTLSGSNTNSGGTVVTGGAIIFASDSQLGASTGGITLDGAAIGNNGVNLPLDASRTITLGTAGGYFSSSQTITVNGPVTGPGAMIVAFNQGAVVLSGSNTYAGATTIGSTASPLYWDNANANPTLRLGNAAALPVGTPLVFGTSSRNNTATLDLNGYSASVGGMTAGTNAIIDNTAAGTATLTMSPSSGTSTFAGVVKNTSGAVSVVKAGAGTQVLAGANTYTGTTTISAGTLQVGNGGTAGALGGGAVVNDGQLTFNRSNALAVSAAISGTGGVSQIGTGTTTLTGGNTFTGNYSHAAGVTVLNRTGGPALFASGSAGTLAITNSVGGANNWYSAVVMGSTNQLGSNVNVAFAPQNVASGFSYLVLQGNDTTIGSLSTTQAYASSWAVVENQETASYGNSRLTVTQTVDGTFTGEFRNGYGTSVGTLGLTKNGAATLTLTAAGGNGINYTGSTIVSAGRLVLKDATGFASSVAVASGATLEVNNGSAQSLGVAISGSGSFVKSGAGTLAFTSVKTYTGDTTVTSGTLSLAATGTSGGASSIASTNIVVNAGATLLMSGTAYNTAIGWGNNATFVLNGGTLDIANNGYSYVKNLVMNNGAAFTLGTGFVPVSVNGANFDLASVVTSASSTAASTISSRGGLNQIGNVVFDVARGTFVGTTDLTVSSTMAGTGSLTKNGSGVLTLTAANTYTGGSVVNAGTLELRDVAATGNGVIRGALTVNPGATVNLTGGGAALGWSTGKVTSLTVNGGLVTTMEAQQHIWMTGGTATLTGGELRSNGGVSSPTATSWWEWGNTGVTTLASGSSSIISGRIRVREDASPTLAFTVADGAATADLLVSAAVTDSGTAGISKAGTGALVLTGSNTYRGTTTISAGTLQVGNGGGTGSLGSGAVTNNAALVFNRSNALTVANAISGSGSVTQAGPGTTTLTAANGYTGGTIVDAGVLATSAADRLAAGGSLTVNAAGTFRMGGNQTLLSIVGSGLIDLGNSTLTTGSQSSTFAGGISGNGGLVKIGPGTLTLSGSNSFTGDTDIQGGTLVLSSSTALARDAVVTMQNGAVLTVNQRTFIGALDQGGGTVNGMGELVSTLTLTNSGALDTVLADGPDFAAGILKRTSGTTTVGAANTFTGSVKVQGGTLRLSGSGSFTAASSLVMSAGATMDLAGKSQEFASVSGAGGTVAVGSGSLVVNNAVDNAFDGAITGSGGLVKQATGRLLLTGASTYTGTTSVAAGNLAVNGSLASLFVDVATPAMLSGTGTLAGDVTIAGFHSPGNSPGVQTIGGNLTYTGTEGGVVWELVGNTADLADRGSLFDGIDVGGSLTFSGSTAVTLVFDLAGSQVNWNDPFWDDDHTGTSGWLLYSVGSSVTGWDTNLFIASSDWYDGFGNLFSDIRPDATFAVAQSDGNLYLTFVAVPEPVGIVLAACGGVIAALVRLRQRRGAKSRQASMTARFYTRPSMR